MYVAKLSISNGVNCEKSNKCESMKKLLDHGHPRLQDHAHILSHCVLYFVVGNCFVELVSAILKSVVLLFSISRHLKVENNLSSVNNVLFFSDVCV